VKSDTTCQREGCDAPIPEQRARSRARYCGSACRERAQWDRQVAVGTARASISIRGDLAERFQAWCEERGVSMAGVLEPRILGAIEAAAD
jgi:hypothetical protein